MTQAIETTESDKVAVVLSSALRTTVFEQYLSGHKTDEESLQDYKNRTTKFKDTGAILLENNDFNSVAIWLPPNYIMPSSIFDPSERQAEVKSKFATVAKKHGLDSTPHWELMFIGKDPKENKGSIRPLFDRFLKQAKIDGIPAILYAISEHAMSRYRHIGFEVLDIVIVGEGVVDKEGKEDKNGEGLKVWLMAYNYQK
ncbi:hypothetical protein BN7_1789 [Wickerhamomyces ciferrii]|uniref:N-acetyltransferase domain-containing protein n=1 Tax=Wickerhamomyces ciferrii (strain ATCC 14091 / BCRC 22168 / CBS 111 / JCM 3599 / NBRC 0793 / NRRL Y-1031 F-60-10) TaxID=1206466 RepID=K0KB69_WICCF|nr:uncharacterized protein BN7_1789 [Wickerhamomyces ciferrii]CCH42245.1 hypothetical protein BN7_1789 [Wickerhamomyces ciferrii]